MIRTAILFGALVLLAGCESPTTPIKICVEPIIKEGGRGGAYIGCNQYKLGCIQPLTLKSENNVLVCRLEQ